MKITSAVLATALMLAMSQFVLSQFAMSQISTSQIAKAAEIKVVSGGAFKQVLGALAAQYEKESGNKVDITYQTVGQHLALIRDGKEEFDVAVLTPEGIDGLAKEGKVVPGTRADLAKVGVGVVVKAGAPKPDISTDEAFKRALLAAKSVAYIDPKAGGSSGIYVACCSGSALPQRSTPRPSRCRAGRSPITLPMARRRSASTRSARFCRLRA